jgi:hypothetical protein
VRIALALDPFLAVRGPGELHLSLLGESAALSAGLSPKLRARVLLALAWAMFSCGRQVEARPSLEEALRAAGGAFPENTPSACNVSRAARWIGASGTPYSPRGSALNPPANNARKRQRAP